MSIHQLKKQSDLEKRLRLLRQQVYGKDPDRSEKSDIRVIPTHQSTNTSTHQNTNTQVMSDTVYLYQDLFKIGILTSFAIGVQVILFFLTKNHILNLNFF